MTRRLISPLILVLTYFLTTSVAAAAETVSGRIVDGSNESPLAGATVRLINAKDTSIVRGVVTKKDGSFEIENVDQGAWRCNASFVGFRKHSSTFFVRSSDVDLGRIALSKDTVNSPVVNVEDEVVAVGVKGDTTEYNSKAYKTNENATAEDLVKKMPGVTIENGQVKAQGEDVRKVLVDGKEFFGDDAASTLRNVPADMVDRVQVFDRASDMSMFSGFDDGNTQKTMNLVTKQNKRTGEFGKFYGGYGSSDRYNAGATFNYFDGAQRLTVLGISNNINQQNFSAQDIIGAMGIGGPMGRMMSRFASSGAGQRMITQGRSGGSSGGSGGRGDFSNFFVNQQGGISTTHSIGTNYADEWGSNTFSGSYFFNYGDNNNNSSLNRDYVTPPDQQYNEETISSSLNRVHRLNMRFESYMDSMNAVIVAPRITFQNGTSVNDALGLTSNQADSLSATKTLNNVFSDGYTGAVQTTFRHKFNREGRTLAASANADFNAGSSDGGLNSLNRFIGIDSTFSLDQVSDQNVNGLTLSGSIAWTEPLSASSMAQLSYEPSFTTSTSFKHTSAYDSVQNSYSIMDTTLTGEFENTYNTHRLQGLYRWQAENTIITVGTAYQIADLRGNETFPDQEIIERKYTNFLPSFMLRQKFSKSSNLQFRYRASTTPPTVTQLQSVVDNSNPIQLRLGNPNLGQDYSHNFSLRFVNSNWMSGRSTFGFLSFTLTNNYIGSSSIVTNADTVVNGVLLPPGAQITAPANLNGYISARSFFTQAVPLEFIKSNVNLNAGVNYSRMPGLVNGATNNANTTTLRGGFFLSTNISSDFDLSGSYDGNYNIVVNSLQREQDANYFTHNATARLIWNIGAVACSTDVNHTLYTGLGEGYDRQYTVWNAGIGYRFFENKSAELRLTVFDLLRQNDNVSRNVNDIYIEDSRTNVITRYAMLTFAYDLKMSSK